ncbi:DUF4239 domain-containing protein [Vannielia litorea]|uniref:DUF4239 domain-containing protein n=1 Tax=Vannielia litorea TaxID=1217970 RepID=A0A1N6E765_9RHOB|nr:DUF4239 domain-containing protein [Vannielia litorea]SIN78879.1 Protein of unknown function [Vannielia litorea]
MYGLNSGLIALVLLASMVAAMFGGRAMAGRRARRISDEGKSQTLAVQASLLAILGLLLGFTFSLALGRYDTRSQAVVEEANAIGTAWLRTDLIPAGPREEARALLVKYAEFRAKAGEVPAHQAARRAGMVATAQKTFDQLWALAAETARAEGGPAVVSFTTSLNDMIDQLSARDAAINRHVPEPVLLLLYGTFILLGWVLGLASAQTGVRPGPAVYAMLLLIVGLVFVIIDLDRPRRGIIEVEQSPIRNLADQLAKSG